MASTNAVKSILTPFSFAVYSVLYTALYVAYNTTLPFVTVRTSSPTCMLSPTLVVPLLSFLTSLRLNVTLYLFATATAVITIFPVITSPSIVISPVALSYV